MIFYDSHRSSEYTASRSYPTIRNQQWVCLNVAPHFPIITLAAAAPSAPLSSSCDVLLPSSNQPVYTNRQKSGTHSRFSMSLCHGANTVTRFCNFCSSFTAPSLLVCVKYLLWMHLYLDRSIRQTIAFMSISKHHVVLSCK